MNDGNVDPAGRYLAGSMAYAFTTGAAELYRLDADRSLHTVLTGVTCSNGIDWSPDGTRCYYVDTPTRKIDVFDYDVKTGALTDRRTYADTSDLSGMPDGLTVDADGGVWVAFWGGGRVVRYWEGRPDVDHRAACHPGHLVRLRRPRPGRAVHLHLHRGTLPGAAPRPARGGLRSSGPSPATAADPRTGS